MEKEIITVCPDCFAEVDSDAVSADKCWAICRNCDGLFPISESLTIPPIPPRPEKRGAAHLMIERSGDSLTLEEPPVRGKFGWLFVLCALAFGGMMCGMFLAAFWVAENGRQGIVFLCLGAFWIIPLSGSVFYVLRLFFYHRVFHFDRESMQRESRLFFLRFRKTIPRSRVWGIRSDWGPTQVGNVYELQLAYDKTTCDIQCRSKEEQLWATAEVNDYFDATASERLCCPVCNRGVPDEPGQDLEPTERKCIWCRAVIDREEAARIGRAEIDDPYRSAYDLLRPLDSPTRIEQAESELTIRFGRRGVQGFWEKIGIACLVLLGLTIFPEIAFLFYPSWEVRYVAFLSLFLSGLFFGFLGWVAVDTFWGTGSLRITRDEFFATRKSLFQRKTVLQAKRAQGATLRELLAFRQDGQSFRCTSWGKYLLAIYNGEESKIQINRRSGEEIRWLRGVTNRFLYRTGGEPMLLRPKCGCCKAVLSLKDWTGDDGETLHCPGCGKEAPFRDCIGPRLEDWQPDPLRRPVEAKARLQRSETELKIDCPSSSESQYGPNSGHYFRLLFYGLFLMLGIVWFYFGGWGGIRACQLFFQVFDPLQAVLLSILLVVCTSGGILAYGLMFWSFANLHFTNWTLAIDQSKIRLTTRAFFLTRNLELERTPEICAECPQESLLERQGLHWRKWLRLRYWLDSEPAWSRDHIRLSTNPPIPFPYRGEEEKEWLLASINDFLQPER